METRDPPSLLNRIVTPPVALLFGVSAISWFLYRTSFLFQHLREPIVLFDKGSYYLLGSGVGMLSLACVTFIEFWGGDPMTKKQNTILSRLAISGVILMFVFPHVAHFAADNYLVKHGYDVCDEASHQWLFFRDIVYIRPPLECSEGLTM